jgi:hypothetical protein
MQKLIAQPAGTRKDTERVWNGAAKRGAVGA